jgi:hypothetical protein
MYKVGMKRWVVVRPVFSVVVSISRLSGGGGRNIVEGR